LQLTRRRLSVALCAPKFRRDFEPQKAQAIPFFVFAVGFLAKYSCKLRGNLRFQPTKLYQATKAITDVIAKMYID